jgi:hypothetical protein
MALLNFKMYFDELERAAFHEAGHAVAMKEKAPGWFLRAELVPNGDRWGGGVTPKDDFPVPSRDVVCVIGVSGCLAEAKLMSKGHHLNCKAMESLAQHIVEEMANQEPTFWVDVPIAGEPNQPAICTRDDFRFIVGSPDLALVERAIADSCVFLEARVNWERVLNDAKILATRPYILE